MLVENTSARMPTLVLKLHKLSRLGVWKALNANIKDDLLVLAEIRTRTERKIRPNNPGNGTWFHKRALDIG
jgi:hypothetical protein